MQHLQRIFRMPLPELVFRGRQETFKWVDRLRPTAGQVPLGRGGEDLGRFVANAERHFFEGLFDKELPAALAIGMTEHLKNLFAHAEDICQGRFDLLGYRGLNLGEQPDWHFDPISNRRAPELHWSRLNPLDYATHGDSKVIWELNRHQWLIRLGQAYRVTREEKYADTVVRHLEDWLRTNPPGIGINWASSLEMAFRLIAWCWTLLLIRDSPALGSALFARLLASVGQHAARIERNLSYYFAPNTHLTGEALGLIYAGVVFPDLKRASRWRSLGIEILTQQTDRQVLPDGVYFERSTCYQRYTVDIYLHLLILAGRGGMELPPKLSAAVRSMIDVLLTLRQPDGSMPSIGDDDGGLVLPLSGTRPNDFRATFSTAAVVFQEPAYAWAAGELAADTLWFFGTAAARIFNGIKQSPPSGDPCRIFPAGGFAVMRNGWGRTDHSLIVDTGPLGGPVSSGHGHAAMLSIQCSVYGQQYLVDAGTCCYTADHELRDFFRGTAAHSTVMIDGKGQTDPAGAFGWKRSSSAHLLRWVSNKTFAFADAEHDGYRVLAEPVSHRRRVIFMKPNFWVMVDDLIGTGSHDVEVRFQFAPVHVQIDDSGWVRASSNGCKGLLLRTTASVLIESQVRLGRRVPMEGWVSPGFGQIMPAPVVVHTIRKGSLPIRLITLLWPSQQVSDETPSVGVTQTDNGWPNGLVFFERAEIVKFDDDEPLVEYGAGSDYQNARRL